MCVTNRLPERDVPSDLNRTSSAARLLLRWRFAMLLCCHSPAGTTRHSWFASRNLREIGHRNLCEFFATASGGPGQCLQQWVSFLPKIALSVVSEEISYIGHPNPLRRRDEPKTSVGATSRFDKSRPGHQLEDLGGLCRGEASRRRDLVRLKRSGGIRQTTKRLERFVDARRQTRTEHASLLWERIVRNQVHILSDLGHPSL